MVRASACLGLAVLFARAIFAQSGSPSPTFEIADVHIRPPNWISGMRTRFARGRYELRNATMVDLIRTAWGVDPDLVIGGPEWLEIDRFDVVALAPAGSNPNTLKTMLRALLEDRFHLAAHQGTRDLPAYALTAAKKPQLQPADGSGDAGCSFQPGRTPPSPRGKPGEPVVFECRNMTMEAFAAAIPNLRGASGYLFNYTVADHTGLTGPWNFRIEWSMRVPGLPNAAGGDTKTIFDAFEKQLGLRLDLTGVPASVVIVDSVNRKPTDNLPGVTEKLPAPPLEFEAADVKPADPDDPIKGSSVNIRPGGLVRVNMTLKGLIQEAWGDFNSDLIVGGPKSMDTTRFVVVAKAPSPDLAEGPAVWNGLDIDSMRMMLRALVIDRFRLAAHNEDRLVSGHALVAARPKLRKADPSNRPGCKEGPGADGKDPRTTNPMASRLVTCRNLTLAQFAAELPNFGYGYLPPSLPVVDETRIDGRFDMTVSFSPWSALRNPAIPAPGGDATASDPDGSIPLFEALDRQLGLKLEARKLKAPVLVIDHVNAMPTDN